MLDRTYFVAGDTGLERVMEKLGFVHKPLEEANFIVYPGGSDISPTIYKNRAHPTTWPAPERDVKEMTVFQAAKFGSIHIGICRGAQLLCALNGGLLYQDVDNHTGSKHPVRYIDEHGVIHVNHVVNSLHHQMMHPIRGPVQVWATANRATYRDLETKQRIPLSDKSAPDPEVVWYPHTRCLCFQAHPEYDHTTTLTLFDVCLTRAIRAVEQGPH